ncbi:hypothetical protein [Nitrosomonas sp. Nm58]|uniref:hypothetical protein n=1 Tax=Nitrosomonas sp. Nm58 TaxID=200126 RepID=UPI000894951F|nr:hypothetical protein [Nitrosomonas sp. Nm58]SDZ07320.1 hypothetical protein SAMN05421754_105216 [Nitrosomonas sp. Nm58]
MPGAPPVGISGESGAQTVPLGVHSGPLQGNYGAGMGVFIPCAPAVPWTGDSVGIILPKPNSTLLELSDSSNWGVGHVIAQSSDLACFVLTI